MKRRSFLGLLGLAPAVPLVAKHLPDLTPPAPKELTPEAAESVYLTDTQNRSIYGVCCSVAWDTSATCAYDRSMSLGEYQRRKVT